jgi:hypothetical protein
MVYLQDGRLLKRFVFVGPKTYRKELHCRQRRICWSKSQDLVPHQWYQHPNVRPGWKHGSGLTLKKITYLQYSQTCIQRPPLGPEKSGRLIEVPDKTEI